MSGRHQCMTHGDLHLDRRRGDPAVRTSEGPLVDVNVTEKLPLDRGAVLAAQPCELVPVPR